MQIGIPRALGYYYYFPFWHGFFKDLGFDVKISGKTTKNLVTKGSSLLVPETCLPVKIYIGHVLDLIDKNVTTIYSPSVQSLSFKVYNCSKLRGLPDLVRNVIKKDIMLVEPTIDKSEKEQGLYYYLAESVKPFGITNKKRIREASKAGWHCYNEYHRLMQAGYSYNQAIQGSCHNKSDLIQKEDNSIIKVGICTHAYNLYDDHFSMKIINKLEGLGAQVFVPDNIPQNELFNGISHLDTVPYWANETEVTGCAGHFMKNQKLDGLITLTAFGCGPDSLMIERITRQSKRTNLPLLNLTIDEHTGEAGMITRLEAFTDMLLRKKRQSLIFSLNKQLKPTPDSDYNKVGIGKQ